MFLKTSIILNTISINTTNIMVINTDIIQAFKQRVETDQIGDMRSL